MNRNDINLRCLFKRGGRVVSAVMVVGLLGVSAFLRADINPVDPTQAKKKCPAACGGAICGDNDCYCDGDYCVIA